MKEIIRHGFERYKTDCPTCSCIFIYEKSDIVSDCFIVCPECNAKFYHSILNKMDESANSFCPICGKEMDETYHGRQYCKDCENKLKGE